MLFNTLEELRDALLAGVVVPGMPRTDGELDWSSLPTFGGEAPRDIINVWSWDATRLLVGESADDLRIVPRTEAPVNRSDIPFDRKNPLIYEDCGNGWFLRREDAPYSEEEEFELSRQMGNCVAFTRREGSPPPLGLEPRGTPEDVQASSDPHPKN